MDLVILQDVKKVVGNIGTSMTTEGVAHSKDDIVEFVVVPKVMNNDSEKVQGVVVSLPSVKGDCQFRR